MDERVDPDAVATELRSQLDEVNARIADLTKPPDTDGTVQFGKRVGEGTTEAIGRFTDVGIANELQPIKLRIERALAKLEEGSYGVCDECGGQIVPGRLRAAPESSLCITCASGRT